MPKATPYILGEYILTKTARAEIMGGRIHTDKSDGETARFRFVVTSITSHGRLPVVKIEREGEPDAMGAKSWVAAEGLPQILVTAMLVDLDRLMPAL